MPPEQNEHEGLAGGGALAQQQVRPPVTVDVAGGGDAERSRFRAAGRDAKASRAEIREIHVGGIASAVDHIGVAAAVDGDRSVAAAVESAEPGDAPMQTAAFHSLDHEAL